MIEGAIDGDISDVFDTQAGPASSGEQSHLKVPLAR